jgi:hypothetical protein
VVFLRLGCRIGYVRIIFAKVGFHRAIVIPHRIINLISLSNTIFKIFENKNKLLISGFLIGALAIRQELLSVSLN